LALLAAGVGYWLLLSEKEITQAEFQKELADAKEIAIVMDTRGLEAGARKDKVLQCGVDYAGSIALGDKNLTNLAFDDKGCATSAGTVSISECESKIKDMLQLRIAYGSNYAKFYKNRALIYLNESYAGKCEIAARAA